MGYGPLSNVQQSLAADAQSLGNLKMEAGRAALPPSAKPPSSSNPCSCASCSRACAKPP